MTLDSEDIKAIADAVWQRVIEGPYNAEELMRMMSAILLGQLSGAGTGTETFAGMCGIQRIVANVDNSGNRVSIIRNSSPCTPPETFEAVYSEFDYAE